MTALTAVERANLGTLVAQVEWHGDDAVPLLELLFGVAAAKRRASQDYKSIIHMLDERTWETALEDSSKHTRLNHDNDGQQQRRQRQRQQQQQHQQQQQQQQQLIHP